MGPRDPGIRPRQADGTPLNYYGVKHVPAQTVGGIHIRIRFHVCDVAQVILSVGELVKNKCPVSLGDQPYIWISDKTEPLVQRGNLWYLPVVPRGAGVGYHDILSLLGTCSPQAVCGLNAAPQGATKDTWHLFEVCCFADSLLSD